MLQVLKFFQLLNVLFQEHQAEADEEQQAGKPDGPAAHGGQCKAAENKGLTAKDITITGFCPPSGMTSYLENGICTRWGLWDCGIQGALGCYLAAYISAGNTVKVGDKIDVPNIGTVEILANSDLVEGQETAEENNGVVLLPERVVFTAENVADYPF